MMSEAKTEAERRRVTSQREVEELTRQKDNISSHLAQVRQLLGGQLGVPMPPSMDPAVSAPPAKPAITEPAPAPAPAGNGGGAPGVAPAAVRQAGNGAPAAPAAQAPRPAGNGVAAKPEGKPEDDENWWTE